MAEIDETQFSLMSLEDELTCSICLSTFDCPVTIPCGHNFCQDCLLATWKDTYSCPQCRTHFATKPELKKNTVLSTVVQTFNLRSSKSEGNLFGEEKKAEEKDVIRCDTCMEAEASQTCLTCMASFCEEHLRPHRENPIFRVHQLSEPVGDLSERICPDHHKLMELFCSQHGRPICSLCLQNVHKGCSFTSPEEQRTQKETDLRVKLGLLDGKIRKNEAVICQMQDMQNKLKDSATNRKKAVAAEYHQMREMLLRQERDALNAVDREMESGQTKLRVFMKKLTENVNNMSKAKEDIHSLLSQSQTLAFLQASVNLPPAVNFDPYAPRISVDSKTVIATHASAAALKDYLAELFKQPVEARLQMIKPGQSSASASGFTPLNTGPYQESGMFIFPAQKKSDKDFRKCDKRQLKNKMPFLFYIHISELKVPQEQQRLPRSHSPGPGAQPKAGPKKKAPKQTKKPSQSTEDVLGNENLTRLKEKLDKLKGCPPAGEPTHKPETSDLSPNVTSAEKRSELLKYGTVLTFDPKTAHKRIILTEDFTKASVSDEHADYPDCPERFAVCSQVLTSKGFSRGRHYWEVRLSSNNFVGIGLAYSSIDRKGPSSRLGRNNQSWCVEWFNVKLSAWHNSSETVLANPSPKRVGVLLDCEAGMATFYNVADRAYPFHSFVFPFAAAVYPAFWIFSSGSSISLCKLQA
ncbi:E3 ubiquitin/ISG15 ligase TRIM25 isoform X2 [Toxotes jaculatrix]|uniref:E3 ubiquitin/ISG15 ligase TRIM25 isoform X2 n=1 Tax=Toxotes jaculatrix TaxID=941984 RepID=UPI001B3B015F|nr:E3 ubiquitin/ISG15 ligase TRIM25 isoform X2 [Toxotes jaculatrix]